MKFQNKRKQRNKEEKTQKTNRKKDNEKKGFSRYVQKNAINTEKFKQTKLFYTTQQSVLCAIRADI